MGDLLDRALSGRTTVPAPEPTGGGSAEPISAKLARMYEAMYDTSILGPAMTIMRNTGRATWEGRPFTPEEKHHLYSQGIAAIPFAGSVRGIPVRSPPRVPSEAGLLASGNERLGSVMRRRTPEYPTGKGQDAEHALWPMAKTAKETFPPETSPRTSPEVYETLAAFKKPQTDIPYSYAERMKVDETIAGLDAKIREASAAAGEPEATGKGMRLGELVKRLENLRVSTEPGARQLADAIEAHIARGPQTRGTELLGRARADMAAAEASAAEAAKPSAPGSTREALASIADRLERGGALPGGIGLAAASTLAHGLGAPGWLTAMAGLGGGGASAAYPVIGHTLGRAVRAVAGKPAPQGEASAAATMARKASPLYEERLTYQEPSPWTGEPRKGFAPGETLTASRPPLARNDSPLRNQITQTIMAQPLADAERGTFGDYLTQRASPYVREGFNWVGGEVQPRSTPAETVQAPSQYPLLDALQGWRTSPNVRRLQVRPPPAGAWDFENFL
jgi:hypothetical protein